MQDKEIYEKLRALLARVLEIEQSEIHEESSLFKDLGIESVDLLDLTFEIEEEFNIEIPPGELWNVGVDFLDEERYLKDGVLTGEGIEELKRRFPLADISSLGKEVKVFDVFGLITIHMIVYYISSKLKGAQA